MNSTAKTILIWVLILVVAVALYNFVERGTAQSPTLLTLTELMEKVDGNEVKDVTISGSNLVGHLKSNPSAEFRSVIPEDYAPIYDRLAGNAVNVTIIPPDANSWLSFVPASLLIAGAILWLAISVVILVLLVDLSKFVKRELGRSRPSTT
jgi:ATP-dependent Zn protease